MKNIRYGRHAENCTSSPVGSRETFGVRGIAGLSKKYCAGCGIEKDYVGPSVFSGLSGTS